MTALLVVLMFVGFVLLDMAVRVLGRRLLAAREQRDRAAVLQTSLRLDFTHEARSLKRVAVERPRATRVVLPERSDADHRRPAVKWKCRWSTAWPPSGPVLHERR